MKLSHACLAGLGSRGRAIAQVLRRAEPELVLVGWDRNPEEQAAALADGVVDEVTSFPQDHLPHCQLLVVATASSDAAETGRRYAPLLPDGALVLDVVRYKQPLLDAFAAPGEGRFPRGGPERQPTRTPPSTPWVSASLWIQGEEDLVMLGPLHDDETAEDALETTTAWFAAAGMVTRVASLQEQDLTTALRLELPQLQKLAHAAVVAELADHFTALSAPRRVALPDLVSNRAALLPVLERYHSVLQDMVGWMNLRDVGRFDELAKEAAGHRAKEAEA